MKLYKCIHISLISDTLYIFILFIFIHFISLVYLSLHFVSLFFLYKDLFKNISSSAVPLVTNFLTFYFNSKIFNFAFTSEDCFCWVYNSEMIFLFSA